MAFHEQELIGKLVCVEMDGGDILAGVFDEGTPNFVCLRGEDGSPVLLNERFIRSIFIKPEVDNDD